MEIEHHWVMGGKRNISRCSVLSRSPLFISINAVADQFARCVVRHTTVIRLDCRKISHVWTVIFFSIIILSVFTILAVQCIWYVTQPFLFWCTEIPTIPNAVYLLTKKWKIDWSLFVQVSNVHVHSTNCKGKDSHK